jgi:glucokinase
MILAGDIGGTKTHLALFDWTSGRVEAARQRTYQSGDFVSFEEVLADFLKPPEPPVEHPEADQPLAESVAVAEPGEAPVIDAACVGVAGPVIDNRCKTTNLPWVVDGAIIADRFQIKRVRLLNDLEATAYGLLVLTPDETVTLNKGTAPAAKQAIALIAAGTGLGESILFWDGRRYRPMPSEGGHSDFAPNSDLEIELLRHLRITHLHVSYERVLSGAGLHAIYEFLRDTKKNEPTWLAERLKVADPAPIISEVGLRKEAEIAAQALDLFASIYGAEAGNLALKCLALDGVYVGGGIAPKILPALADGRFLRAFRSKAPFEELLTAVPVKVILNPDTGLLGAAVYASRPDV